MKRLRVAVVGAGNFGRNHARAIAGLGDVELAAVVDPDLDKASSVAAEYGGSACGNLSQVDGRLDAAVIAAPTTAHEALATALLQNGVDVLVEKPIALTSEAGERMAVLARERSRLLQVGHLERFNPAVMALEKSLTIPLFFEVHRLSVFTPRSLDVDVVLDLMIHDLDIVLKFTGEQPQDVQAAGISVLSGKVDIANVRLSFPSGCIANLTASRVSTEQVRKLRLFQPREYLSVDYKRQDATRMAVDASGGSGQPKVGFEALAIAKAEPLVLELESFFECVRTRQQPRVDGFEATAALGLAEQILVKIRQHSELVARTFATPKQ